MMNAAQVDRIAASVASALQRSRAEADYGGSRLGPPPAFLAGPPRPYQLSGAGGAGAHLGNVGSGVGEERGHRGNDTREVAKRMAFHTVGAFALALGAFVFQFVKRLL
jgi:hypothetical protein